ncbi:MAG: DUF1329 domain-containing protein [Myxococcales bacterium]|nr:DUF1329 domain-containing protein [Myxococcales bacterium]
MKLRIPRFGWALVSTVLLAAHLARAEPEPGAIISHANRDAVRGLFPDELWQLVVEPFAELRLEIVPAEDYRPHEKFVEATARYACQSSLDENGQLIGHVAGEPFPYSAWSQEATGHACDLTREDPQFALKVAWNVNRRWFGGGGLVQHWGQGFARGEGRDTWKLAQGIYRRTYFSHRADLLPESTQIAPNTDVLWAEFTDTLTPFDLRGQRSLIFRYKNSHERRDDAWAYVPQQRRARRLSTNQKSDSVLGSEMTYEDFLLFSGYIWDQEWEAGVERPMLAALDSERVCFPKNVPGWRDRALAVPGTREHFDACRFGPYETLPLVDERWQKRTVLRLEQVPRNENHRYSKKVLWYDKETYAPLVFLAYDRAGEPNRIGWFQLDWSETSDVPGNAGHRVLLPIAFMVVNFGEGTTNLTQMWTAHIESSGPEETLRYFDATRLKSGN